MKSTMLSGISLITPSWSSSMVASWAKATSMLSMRPSSTMPEGVTTRAPACGGGQIGIDGLEAHLGLEGAHQELAHGDRLAVEEERPHAQVGVHALHPGGDRRCRRSGR